MLIHHCIPQQKSWESVYKACHVTLPPSFPFSFPPSLPPFFPPHLYLPPSIGSPRVWTSWLLWSRRRLRAWEDKTMCALDTSLCCESMLWSFFLPDLPLSLNNAWLCFQCVCSNVLQYPVWMLVFFFPISLPLFQYYIIPNQGFIQEPWESPSPPNFSIYICETLVDYSVV